jgi:hypothetical protein
MVTNIATDIGHIKIEQLSLETNGMAVTQTIWSYEMDKSYGDLL